MKKILVQLLAACCLMSVWGIAHAQVKVVRGEATMTVQGGWNSNGPTDVERESTLKSAKLAAWRSYLAQPGQNETVDQIRSNEKIFLDQLDNLLVDVVTVDESFNKENKRYSLRIKATVAESVVSSILRGLSKKAGRGLGENGGGASVLGGSPIMVLGMAREAEIVKSFLEKQTNVTEASRDSEANRSKISAGGRSAETTMTTDRTKEVTGGNREKKRDKITYKIGNVGILNAKLPRVLLQNGIKASPYAFLMKACKLPDPDNFSKQYAASELGELPSKVLAQIQENLVGCGRVRYWVFASMDTGGYGGDPNTGLSLATVTVNVQLYEVDTGAQVAAASKDVSGRSADQTDAIRLASENAVQAVGDIITSQVANLVH